MIIKKQFIDKKEKKQGDINNTVNISEAESSDPSALKKEITEEEVIKQFEDIDISSVNFKERIERRRGDRRRGYRRIDERSLVSRAQEEALNIREVAKKEGYQQGLNEASSEIQKLSEGLKEFFSGKREIYEEISKDIMEIALEVAKKIIKKEVELSNEVLRSVLSEVLEQVGMDEQKLSFKVSEQDYESAINMIPDLLKKSRIDAKVIITPSDEVEKGSCILIANNGVIDANFKTQLKIIQMAFGIYNGRDNNF